METKEPWDEMFRYAVANWDSWDAVEAERLFPMVMNGIYGRPDSAWRFFDVAWRFQKGHGDTELSLAQTLGVYRRSGKYEAKPLGYSPDVDVIIPYWAADRHLVSECVRRVLGQWHVTPVVHVIGDGCEAPEDLPVGVRVNHYSTPGGWGPYRIANAVVAGGHCQAKYLAIQDADDLAVPDRLWRQVATMERLGYEMASGAIQNIAAEGYDGSLHNVYPTIAPWRVFPSVPKGHLINTTRTMTRDLFKRVNGFSDMRCGMDWDLDNRILHVAGTEMIPVFGSLEVDCLRQLHSGSLTIGSEFKFGSKGRLEASRVVEEHLKAMIQTPTLAMAASLGGLDKAPSIKRVSWGLVDTRGSWNA